MSLFTALSVSATGLTAQRQRAELLVENLANSETTRTAEGGPYRRKDAVFSTASVDTPFQSMYASELGNQASGVQVSEIVTDTRDPERRYMPGHPDADTEGYVKLPNVNPAEDMVDLMSASRNYQANVTAMSAVKDMIHRSIDLLR
ncbi:flagellar basal body rod protein FlgC [Paludibaculum fermentans]|uniref:Flagellar basal-body rod protein FlgC n=1 Tax=Paludibaculum fermentans TaxID=1473598 RepID=A0A7S7NTC1_PALFE|nr:flagellar basal body rod protein FlgC [Paludibaculum fermentans]QOY88874.1 flagellar basal body rod protein FlgC [Paludibaculum fermentans]